MSLEFESMQRDELHASLIDHREWLQRLARQLVRDPVEAEDVAQDVWVSALEHPPRRTLGLRPWLAVVVRRLVLVRARAKARRHARDERAARPEATPSTAELIEKIDVAQRVARELVALEEPYRTTLLLRFTEGLDAVEIAQRTGLPAGTVRWRTKQGLDELRRRLARAFGGESALSCVLLRLAEPAPAPAVVALGSAAAVGAWLAAGALAAGTVALVALAPWEEEVRGEAPESSAARVAARVPGVLDTQGSDPDRMLQPHEAASVRVPLAEDAGATAGPRPAELARVHILESDGQPHAQRTILVLPSSTEGLAQYETDAQGWLELPAGSGRRELAIERLSAFPHRAEIDLVPGERELTLPEGEVLEGRIVVNGGAPPRPVEIEVYPANLSSDESYLGGDPLAAVRSEFARGKTDGAGRFLFRGLRPEQGYGIRLGYGHVIPGTFDSSSGQVVMARFFVPRPTRGLVYEVERLPCVIGRIVELDGRPSPGGLVEGQVTRTNGTGFHCGARADQEGIFELFLDGPWSALQLQYWGVPGERGKTSLALRPEDAPAHGDLGDLRLVRGTTLRLRVVDPEGEPITGARTSLESAPTDQRGETTLQEVTGGSIRVAAMGFATVEATLSDEDPLVVVLPRAPELALQIFGVGAEPLGWIDVELSSAERLFSTNEGLSPSTILQEARRGRCLSGGTRNGGHAAQFHADARGELTVDSLNPGIPLELRLLVRGEPIHFQQLLPLGPEERRQIRIDVDRELVVLQGRVVDPAGTPIVGARSPLPMVQTEGPTKQYTVESDANGRFRAVLLDVGFELAFSKAGYLPRPIRFPRVPREEVEIVLERGRDLAIAIVDEAGEPVPGCKVRAHEKGQEAWTTASARAAGRFEFLGLTHAVHEVQVEVGTGLFRQSAGVLETELVFRVPVMGAVEASWDVSPVGDCQCLEIRSLESESRPLQELFLDTPRGTYRFDPVLPGSYEVVLKDLAGEDELVLARQTLTLAPRETAIVRF